MFEVIFIEEKVEDMLDECRQEILNIYVKVDSGNL